MEESTKLDMINLYDSRLLAGRTKLALLRASHIHKVHETDKLAFERFKQFLISANEGCEAVTGSNLTATSEESVKAFQEMIGILNRKTNKNEQYKEKINSLIKTVEELIKGNIPEEHRLVYLTNFLDRYSLLQKQLLEEKRSFEKAEVHSWPQSTLLEYSLLSL